MVSANLLPHISLSVCWTHFHQKWWCYWHEIRWNVKILNPQACGEWHSSTLSLRSVPIHTKGACRFFSLNIVTWVIKWKFSIITIRSRFQFRHQFKSRGYECQKAITYWRSICFLDLKILPVLISPQIKTIAVYSHLLQFTRNSSCMQGVHNLAVI